MEPSRPPNTAGFSARPPTQKSTLSRPLIDAGSVIKGRLPSTIACAARRLSARVVALVTVAALGPAAYAAMKFASESWCLSARPNSNQLAYGCTAASLVGA